MISKESLTHRHVRQSTAVDVCFAHFLLFPIRHWLHLFFLTLSLVANLLGGRWEGREMLRDREIRSLPVSELEGCIVPPDHYVPAECDMRLRVDSVEDERHVSWSSDGQAVNVDWVSLASDLGVWTTA